MGRQPDHGTESYASVRQAADLLGVKVQAIYNRIHSDPPTIPFEKDLDETTGRPSYRIPRGWLDREVEKRKPLRVEHGENLERQLLKGRKEILARFDKGVELLRAEVEVQHTKLEPLLEEIRAELQGQRGEFVEASEDRLRRFEVMVEMVEGLSDLGTRLEGQLEAIRNAQAEMYKQNREVIGRTEESNRRETTYQQSNLELATENRDLQRQTLDLLRRVEEAERERAERGQAERRSFWRRLFSRDEP